MKTTPVWTHQCWTRHLLAWEGFGLVKNQWIWHDVASHRFAHAIAALELRATLIILVIATISIIWSEILLVTVNCTCIMKNKPINLRAKATEIVFTWCYVIWTANRSAMWRWLLKFAYLFVSKANFYCKKTMKYVMIHYIISKYLSWRKIVRICSLCHAASCLCCHWILTMAQLV